MDFTTEDRRRMTKTAELADEETKEYLTQNIDLAYTSKVEEDATNNELFRLKNSELTGLAVEYRYLTGTDMPTLDETEYPYIEKDEDGNLSNSTYWDSEILQVAATLEEKNDWHLNLREGTSIKYPVHPDKYGEWDITAHPYDVAFDLTEDNICNAIDTVLTGMLSSATATTIPATVEIYESYREYTNGLNLADQKFMTIYQNLYPGDSTYLSESFNADDEWVFINKSDPNNFAFGKIIESKTKPSRVLFVPYAQKGTIPDDAKITTYVDYTITADLNIINAAIIETVNTLRAYYELILHYLEYNPNGDASNATALSTINSAIALIDAWDEDPTTADTLVSNIEFYRTTTVKSDRVSYINTYLASAAAETLYEERFTVIDYRLSKKSGTLRNIMINKKGATTITEVFEDKESAAAWINEQFFLVKKALKDGDYYMRLFIEDSTGLSVGDECYILTDDDSVPEIHAKVSEIVTGRIEDMLNTVYDEENETVTYVYKDCEKVFFKDLNLRNFVTFTNKYLTTDNLRIIKELS